MGYLNGGVSAGILMLIVQGISIYFWIPNLASGMIYIVLLIILEAKPNGLFYRKKNERGQAA